MTETKHMLSCHVCFGRFHMNWRIGKKCVIRTKYIYKPPKYRKNSSNAMLFPSPMKLFCLICLTLSFQVLITIRTKTIFLFNVCYYDSVTERNTEEKATKKTVNTRLIQNIKVDLQYIYRSYRKRNMIGRFNRTSVIMPND